jgi:hypothetical protein
MGDNFLRYGDCIYIYNQSAYENGNYEKKLNFKGRDNRSKNTKVISGFLASHG